MNKNQITGISGLCNLGNTCYVNSAIQILLNMNEMNKYFEQIDIVNKNENSIMLKEWLDLYKIMAYNNVIVNPERFIKYLHNVAKIKNNELFSDYSQNDSVEFFHFMIDCFHESLKNVDQKLKFKLKIKDDKFSKFIKSHYHENMSIIQKLQSGFYKITILNNENVLSTNYEHFFMIHIPLFEFSVSSLDECLKLHFKDEIMEGDNAYYHEESKKKVDVIKRTSIIHLPEYLTIHLKRWNYNLRKNNKRINYTHEIDLIDYVDTKYSDKNTKYELTGIINHTGNVFGGHYYAFVKKVDDNWYCMNDKLIKRVDPNKLINGSNYCLFYKKIK